MYVHQTYVCSQIKNRIDAVTIIMAGTNNQKQVKEMTTTTKAVQVETSFVNATTFLMWDRKEVIDLRISRRTINLKEFFL